MELQLGKEYLLLQGGLKQLVEKGKSAIDLIETYLKLRFAPGLVEDLGTCLMMFVGVGWKGGAVLWDFLMVFGCFQPKKPLQATEAAWPSKLRTASLMPPSHDHLLCFSSLFDKLQECLCRTAF